jgi:hypothetical protein
MVGGLISHLIGQNAQQDVQQRLQDAQQDALQAQMASYVLQDPDSPMPLKQYAHRDLMSAMEQHGGKEIQDQLPQFGKVLTMLAAGPMLAQAQQQQAQAQQPPTDRPSPFGPPTTPDAQAQPTPPTLQQLANLPSRQQPPLTPAMPTSLATLAGNEEGFSAAGPGYSPAQSAAGEPARAPAAPATAPSPPTLRQLADMPPLARAPVGAIPPAQASTTTAQPPAGHPGLLRRILGGIGAVGAGMQGYSAWAEANRQRQQLTSDIQRERTMLPMQIERARQVGNFQMAQNLAQLHADREAQIGEINKFYSDPATLKMYEDAGWGHRELAEARLGAIGQIYGYKPAAESPTSPYTLTDDKGNKVNVMADRAGNVDINSVNATQLRLPEDMVGKRVRVDQIPGWSLQGKTTAPRTAAASSRDRLADSLLISGQAKTKAEADKMAADMDIARAKRLATGMTGEPLTEAEMLPIVQQDIATGQRTPMGHGDSANNITYQRVRSRELAKSVGLGLGERADYKALSGALTTMETRYAQLQQNENLARYNLEKAIEFSKQVPRGWSRLWNEWKQLAEGELSDDPELRQFQNYVELGMNEVAQLVSSSTGGTVTTDSAKAHARRMLSTTDPEQTFEGAANAMIAEAETRVRGNGEVIENIRTRIRGLVPSGGGAAGGGAAAAGKIPVPLKSGGTAFFGTQEQADRFKQERPDLVR